MSWSADTVSRIMSKLPACFAIASLSFEMITSSAPSRFPSSTLLADVVKSEGPVGSLRKRGKGFADADAA